LSQAFLSVRWTRKTVASKARQVGDDGDLVYVGGFQAMVTDTKALAQGARISLETLKGESLFHPQMGIDLQAMSRSADNGKSAITSALMRSGRVKQVISVDEIATLDKSRTRTFAVRIELVNSQEEILVVDTNG
jgi:hypothetical protein